MNFNDDPAQNESTDKSMVKHFIKRALPAPALRALRSFRDRCLTTEQIFSRIYEVGAWGRSEDPASPFFSGPGSRGTDAIAIYVESVANFLQSFDVKPNAVDLGCGDFFVGSQIRPFCNRYVACDVVPSLIAHNRARFKDLNVEFHAMDLTESELPPGDIVFVRQVLQHLSNAQISKFIARAPMNYKFLVITEHLPSRDRFVHNLDKFTGSDIRITDDSGVVLTSPPFNLRPKMERELCRVNSVDTGILVTTAYGF